MSETCSRPRSPLDADGLLSLAVLMALYDQPLSAPEVAGRVGRLAAPGFDPDRQRVGAAMERLHATGHLDAEGLDPDGEITWRIARLGRELAHELGGRAPGTACDATRTCLLLRLCLDGTMPEQNRRVLVASLLAAQADAATPESGVRPEHLRAND